MLHKSMVEMRLGVVSILDLVVKSTAKPLVIKFNARQ